MKCKITGKRIVVDNKDGQLSVMERCENEENLVEVLKENSISIDDVSTGMWVKSIDNNNAQYVHVVFSSDQDADKIQSILDNSE